MKKIWIGTPGPYGRFAWAPCPKPGMQRSMQRYQEVLNFEDGTSNVYSPTSQYSSNYSLALAGKHKELDGISFYNELAAGKWGREKVYLANPMEYETNLFPPSWADPGLTERGWVSPVYTASGVAVDRTNFATNPRGIGGVNASTTYANAWLGPTTDRGFGTGGAGTYSSAAWLPAAPSDVPTLGDFARKQWTTASTTSSDTGFQLSKYGTGGTPVTPGQSVAISAYLRKQSSTSKNGYMRAIFFTSGGVQISDVAGPVFSIPQDPNWVRASAIFTAPATAAFALFIAEISGTSSVWAVNDILDITGILAEKDVLVLDSYFDGSLPSTGATLGYLWTGAANASNSNRRAYSIVHGDTPASPYRTMPRRPVFSIAGGAYENPTTSPKVPVLILPVPPGYTLWFGVCGTVHVGGVEVICETWNSGASVPSNGFAAPLLSESGATRLNTSVVGVAGGTAYARIWIRKTTSGMTRVALSSMMAQLYPTGTTPPLAGLHESGQGNLGLKFADDARVEEYPFLRRRGLSTTLREVAA